MGSMKQPEKGGKGRRSPESSKVEFLEKIWEKSLVLETDEIAVVPSGWNEEGKKKISKTTGNVFWLSVRRLDGSYVFNIYYCEVEGTAQSAVATVKSKNQTVPVWSYR